MGRLTTFTHEKALRVIEGLSQGVPLTLVCEPDDMPCDDTVRAWAEKDADFARAIAHARERGHDRIAMDALDIADDAARDTIIIEKDGQSREVCNTEWIARSKLRVWTRLQLLAKWNPRYAEKQVHEGNPNRPIEHHHTHEMTPAEAYRKAIEGDTN